MKVIVMFSKKIRHVIYRLRYLMMWSIEADQILMDYQLITWAFFFLIITKIWYWLYASLFNKVYNLGKLCCLHTLLIVKYVSGSLDEIKAWDIWVLVWECIIFCSLACNKTECIGSYSASHNIPVMFGS